jgi:hypothetical protein
MGGGPLWAAAALCAAIGLAPARACAEDPIFGRDTLHGLVEIGAAAADGERQRVGGRRIEGGGGEGGRGGGACGVGPDGARVRTKHGINVLEEGRVGADFYR